MNDSDQAIMQTLVKYAVAGAFGGMVVVGAVLWFDVSGIGSMFHTTQHPYLASIFLGGSMLKGGLLGFAVGCCGVEMKKKAVEPARSSFPANRALAAS